jgi:hypothetical protein
MNRTRIFMTAIAVAGLAASAPAFAQILGGSTGVGVGGGGSIGVGSVTRGGIGVDTVTRGGVGVRTDTSVDADVDVDARTNTRIPRSDRHRARHRHHDDGFVGAGVSGGLGLHTGMIVRDRAGATVGTISQLRHSSDGSIRSVLVARADGDGAVRLTPGSLDVHSSGSFATTSAIRAGRGR